MIMDVYGSFKQGCDIYIAGECNGFIIDDSIDNSFNTRYEALASIKDWAERDGVEVYEISFD